MYVQAAIKPNTLLRNGAYGIVMRGVQKCTRGCSSLRGKNKLPLCCIKLDTATDPACGTFGFMIAADRYVRDHTENYDDLSQEQANFEINEAFSGCELVHDTHRLALMNAMLHGIQGPIYWNDTLSDFGKSLKDFDVVLTKICSDSGHCTLSLLPKEQSGYLEGNKAA